MATQVMLPKLGQTMEEGAIVEWLKQEGDPVSRGDVLYSLESDKAVLEVEAKAKGFLLKILVGPGEKVPVGTTVAIIGQPDEDISGMVAGGVGAAPPSASAEPAANTVGQDTAQPSGGAGAAVLEAPAEEAHREALPAEEIPGRARIFVSPRARRLAEERGVALEALRGSGPDGRIVERDVEAYLERQPAATPLARREAESLGVSLTEVAAEGRVRVADVQRAVMAPAARVQVPAEGSLTPMSGLRGIIAERMAASSQTAAAVTLEAVVDATEMVALRETLKDAYAQELGFSIGYNDILAVIVARCLREYPYMNARLEEDGIRQLPFVNLGLAVDSERGLLVTVIRDADTMGIRDLAVRFREVVARAREGRAMPDDLTGGTFTITNLGMFGVDAFTPIINLPECAILGVGRIRAEPAVVEGRVEVRQRMWLSLTFDHRLVDGAPAARFLQGIARYVESPYLLLA